MACWVQRSYGRSGADPTARAARACMERWRACGRGRALALHICRPVHPHHGRAAHALSRSAATAFCRAAVAQFTRTRRKNWVRNRLRLPRPPSAAHSSGNSVSHQRLDERVPRIAPRSGRGGPCRGDILDSRRIRSEASASSPRSAATSSSSPTTPTSGPASFLPRNRLGGSAGGAPVGPNWVIFDRGSGLCRPAHFRFAPKADVRP